MVVGHTVAYVDQEHISQTYATQLVTVFRRAFRRQLFGWSLEVLLAFVEATGSASARGP